MDGPGAQALPEAARSLRFWVRTLGEARVDGWSAAVFVFPTGTDQARLQRRAHPAARSITEGFNAAGPFLQVKPIQMHTRFVKETGTWI
jgi:hypothetical protein